MLQEHRLKTSVLDDFLTPFARFACLCSLAFLVVLGAVSPAQAGDDWIVIPEGASFHISHDHLLANDPRGVSVTAVTPPARGQLTGGPAGLDYTPAPAFEAFGMDSFTYQAAGTTHRVLLIAGLDDTLEATGPSADDGGSCGLVAGWWIENYDGSLPSPSFVSGAGTECGAYFDLSSPGQIARLGPPGGGGPSTPGGGHTSMIMDPGDDPNGGGTQNGGQGIEWSVAVDDLGNPVIRLVESADGELIAEVLDGATVLGTTAAVARPVDRYAVGLTWWFESDAGSRDGGLVLEVDGRIADALVGLPLGAQDLRWSFGPEEVTQPATPATLWSAKVFSSGSGARFPIFSDHGHGGVAAWSGTIQGGAIQRVPRPGDPAYRLSVPLAANAVQLVNARPEGLTSYRARFELDPESLVLPDYLQVTLLEARSPGAGGQGSVEPFEVQLRWHPLYGFQVRGRTLHNTFLKSTPWTDISTGASLSTLELSWRASSSGPARNGFFSLRVDDGAEETIGGLHNVFMRVDEVRLGLADLPINASGSLIVDTFDAWR